MLDDAAVLLHHLQRDVGIAALGDGDIGGQELQDGGFGGADDDAAVAPAAQGLGVGFQSLHQVAYLTDMGQQLEARLGGAHSMGLPLEQPGAQLLLQVTEPPRGRCHRQLQPVGCA